MRYIQELKDGGFRDVTELESTKALKIGNERKRLIKEKDNLEQQIKKIYDDCNHPVCFDEPGFMYDSRICVQCGHISLL